MGIFGDWRLWTTASLLPLVVGGLYLQRALDEPRPNDVVFAAMFLLLFVCWSSLAVLNYRRARQEEGKPSSSD